MSAAVATAPADLAGESQVSTQLQDLLLESYAVQTPVYEAGQTRQAWLAAFALAALRQHAWRPASSPPEALPHGPHYGVQVLAVIDDPRFQMNGDEPFVDVASWWPAEKKWTVTHQVRSDAEAADHPVRVVAWQPMLALPSTSSELWRCVA